MNDRCQRHPPYRPVPARLLPFLLLACVAAPAPKAHAQDRPLDLDACIRLALDANPGFQAGRAELEATRADLVGARSGRYPSLGLNASAARYESGGTGAQNRHQVGLALSQTIYRGGRVAAGVNAAAAAVDAGEGALDAARADLVLAVKRSWYSVLQGERLVLSAEEGVARSRLNLEYAEVQLDAGLGTRPDVLRARVDVSAAELELTRARNDLERTRAVLNTLMGRSPAQPLGLADEETEAPLPVLPSWEQLRQTALASREELGAVRARTSRQEALVRIAKGAFFPSISTDAELSRGAVASQDPERRWSLGVGLSLPLFEGFANSADLQAQRALLDAAEFDELAVTQAIEAEVWDAFLAEDESARRLENAEALYEAAVENLEAAQESYRLGLGSMIGLVDARTAFTGAEQTLIQAVYDRRIARAVLERVVEGDTFGRNQL